MRKQIKLFFILAMFTAIFYGQNDISVNDTVVDSTNLNISSIDSIAIKKLTFGFSTGYVSKSISYINTLDRFNPRQSHQNGILVGFYSNFQLKENSFGVEFDILQFIVSDIGINDSNAELLIFPFYRKDLKSLFVLLGPGFIYKLSNLNTNTSSKKNRTLSSNIQIGIGKELNLNYFKLIPSIRYIVNINPNYESPNIDFTTIESKTNNQIIFSFTFSPNYKLD
jgi:hypothetical protein